MKLQKVWMQRTEQNVLHLDSFTIFNRDILILRYNRDILILRLVRGVTEMFSQERQGGRTKEKVSDRTEKWRTRGGNKRGRQTDRLKKNDRERQTARRTETHHAEEQKAVTKLVQKDEKRHFEKSQLGTWRDSGDALTFYISALGCLRGKKETKKLVHQLTRTSQKNSLSVILPP